jgi:hypothetical protein
MVTLLKGEDKGRFARYFAIPVGEKTRNTWISRTDYDVYGADVVMSILQERKCARRSKCWVNIRNIRPVRQWHDAMEREDRRVSLKQFELEFNLSHGSVWDVRECIGCPRVRGRWMPEHLSPTPESRQNGHPTDKPPVLHKWRR